MSRKPSKQDLEVCWELGATVAAQLIEAGMATAAVALIVSITSACFTLGGLIWNLTPYRLSGARLRVDLLFLYRDDVHVLLQKAGSKRRPWVDPHRDVAEAATSGLRRCP